MKYSLHIFAPFIRLLFNRIISLSSYPHSWKTVQITPLNKIANLSSPSDTRPIGNLPHLAKIFDSFLAKQIFIYLESNNIMVPYQSAYRSNYSTQTALLRITE